MPSSSALYVDGHVHVHPAFDETTFLETAHENLSANGEGMPTLFMAESAGTNMFARWRSSGSPWDVTLTEEPDSLVLGGKLLVFAGRQILTAERVEILALLSAEAFKDGLPMEESLKQIQEAGGIPLLPWGVGKWLGKRGRLVAETASRHNLLLGDNAGRPIIWPAPALFNRHVVLPGSDPLRLQSEQDVVGTYGFVLDGPFDLRKPASEVRRALRALSKSPRSFGRRACFLRFLRQQLGLRLKAK